MSIKEKASGFQESIHEEKKREKATAKKVLELAKKQEKEKIKNGSTYVRIDANTIVLRK
jgi:hypothetical protein